ncbi:FAD-binding oxidoreductase [Cellvibrio japonicus]|nr:FAD-dependent oxidoreductase [Cellvibrio japonicus]QEI11700.1 FAD-dependent oxidoreductase [Cellvibrio japonicus]QEI15274.1 FAD-dependent oxidoreductase [Cellvibrio japonicus]QEI18854.1 FAD-dependent oxidoreductase [Cellvibrio japonicus]
MNPVFFSDMLSVAGVKIISRDEAAVIYGADTGASDRRPSGALLVKEVDAIPQILALANRHKVPLWPISGGRNFGYGTALPVDSRSVVLDLSQLRRVHIDVNSATALIEPGVTQADLHSAIARSGAKLLVPTTGVGPNGNILGNALDGGYGLTPFTDHFNALSELEGYWGNGTEFRHGYRDLHCGEMAKRWSAGTGTAWAGLLRQGNMGIVTRARVQLARAPEATRILVFEWRNQADFIASQPLLNSLTEDIPGIGGIIMMNDCRILSTQVDTPLASNLRGKARQDYLQRLAKERKISPWTGLGTLYGSRASVAGAVRDIRRRLRLCRVWSFTPAQIKTLQKIESYLPTWGFTALRRHLGALVNTLGTVEGYPIVAFLKIAYALDPRAKQLDVHSHPAKDGAGILWYAPLVPFTGEEVERYRQVMSNCLLEHGFDPLLAVTSRNSRVLSGTIPLLFDRHNPEAVTRAKHCYRALVKLGLENGWPPYRLGVDYMELIACPAESPSAQVQRLLKQALDSNNIIASGRYEHAKPLVAEDISTTEPVLEELFSRNTFIEKRQIEAASNQA